MKYITILDAAKFMGKSDRTIRKWIYEGKIRQSDIVWEDTRNSKRQLVSVEALTKIKNGYNVHVELLEVAQDITNSKIDEKFSFINI